MTAWQKKIPGQTTDQPSTTRLAHVLLRATPTQNVEGPEHEMSTSMTTITMDLRFLTPAYLGGAGPAAELRPPSIKGSLRFWLRAVDPGFRDRESDIFGGKGAGAGQSRVLLRVHSEDIKHVRWERQRFQKRFTKGQGTHSTNGLVYLGYPFQLEGNLDRTAIDAGTPFTLRCVIPRPFRAADAEQNRRALLATLWAFATCGGLGMRSRRGFGSLALDAWNVDGNDETKWRQDMERLRMPSSARDAAGWAEQFAANLKTIREWLGEFRTGAPRATRHPHLGPKASARLSPEGVRDKKDWEAALAHAGLQLQTFRQRMAPDYANVKEHLRFRSGEGGVRIKVAPERVAFGLPLAFRYSSLKGRVRSTIFVPHEARSANGKPLERHPSPLLLKLVELPDGLHSLWLRLDGPRPGTEPRSVERGGREPLGAPTRDLVGEFLANPDARMEG